MATRAWAIRGLGKAFNFTKFRTRALAGFSEGGMTAHPANYPVSPLIFSAAIEISPLIWARTLLVQST